MIRFSFSIRLEGEVGFFPVSVFARTEEAGKGLIQERYSGKVAEFKNRTQKVLDKP